MEEKLYLGVDIGGTAAKLGIVSGEGGIIGEIGEYSVNFDGYRTPIIETIIKGIHDLLSKRNMASSMLSGIGVSATGGINSKSGTVEGSAGHIENWLGTNIKDRLEKEFGVRTEVLNDANAAALGEMWKGAAKGLSDVVVVTIGTGVGGGIIVNSKVLIGQKGFAGEVGHTPLYLDGELCSCKNRGCLEYYGSTRALVREVSAAIDRGEISGIDKNGVDGRLIFEEVKKGNAEVSKYVDRWQDDIAAGIVGFVHIFNPEMVIIGGGVSKQKELFIDKVREKVLTRVMANFARDLRIEAAALGNDAGIIGAVRFVMDSMQ